MNPLSVIVRTVCNVFAWFMVIFGAYVIVHGHLSPGGGFQGGAVVATFIAFLLVAHGGKRLLGWVKEGLFSAAESTGLLIFLGAGLFGISTTFFYNFLAKKGGLFGSVVPLGSNPGVLNSSGTIALMNLAVGLEVVAGLSFIIVYMFKGIRIELEGEEENHDR
ncbi:MAG TPA: MnhB domain-containing protein [Thermosynergistes sp.]|nr:MnhB domain-containing protein [Thermosynergistes sp.]